MDSVLFFKKRVKEGYSLENATQDYHLHQFPQRKNINREKLEIQEESFYFHCTKKKNQSPHLEASTFIYEISW